MKVGRIINFTVFWALWLVYDLPVALAVWGVFLCIQRGIAKVIRIE